MPWSLLIYAAVGFITQRRLRAGGAMVIVPSTGYAGEALGYELFLPAGLAASTWNRLLSQGAVPVGLGARDTLRLEAGLPLYGHELGTDTEGRPIPIFACPLARFAVSLHPARVDFIGRPLGKVTNGTVAPYWVFPGPDVEPSAASGKRAVALMASDLPDQALVQVDIRGKAVAARVVPRLLCADSPPYTRPLLWGA